MPSGASLEFDEDEYYDQLYYEELYKENLTEIAKKEYQKFICPNCEHLWEHCTCQKLD
jgi:hypothetical protein